MHSGPGPSLPPPPPIGYAPSPPRGGSGGCAPAPPWCLARLASRSSPPIALGGGGRAAITVPAPRRPPPPSRTCSQTAPPAPSAGAPGRCTLQVLPPLLNPRRLAPSGDGAPKRTAAGPFASLARLLARLRPRWCVPAPQHTPPRPLPLPLPPPARSGLQRSAPGPPSSVWFAFCKPFNVHTVMQRSRPIRASI